MGPYNSKAIANLFIEMGLRNKQALDPMKLQKLIFFAHGYYLALTKKKSGNPTPLVNEFFEAWEYGPVLPSVYKEFREFRANGITRMAFGFNSEIGTNTIVLPPEDDGLLEKVSKFVWDAYSNKHSIGLSNLTHKQNGAWDKARKKANGIRGKDVENEDILADFEGYVTAK